MVVIAINSSPGATVFAPSVTDLSKQQGNRVRQAYALLGSAVLLFIGCLTLIDKGFLPSADGLFSYIMALGGIPSLLIFSGLLVVVPVSLLHLAETANQSVGLLSLYGIGSYYAYFLSPWLLRVDGHLVKLAACQTTLLFFLFSIFGADFSFGRSWKRAVSYLFTAAFCLTIGNLFFVHSSALVLGISFLWLPILSWGALCLTRDLHYQVCNPVSMAVKLFVTYLGLFLRLLEILVHINALRRRK